MPASRQCLTTLMTKKRFLLFNGPVSKRYLHHRAKPNEVNSPSDETVPRITNDTVTQHRQEVLSGARKYIYPLRHSRRKIVMITVAILVAAIIGFMTYITVSLYRWQSTSAFTYQVTKVIPFPVGRIGGHLISYESYLFELRHYIHYFQTQQGIDFNSSQGKAQLAQQREKTLQDVVNFAYVQQIAHSHHLTVSASEVNDQIVLLRQQNKLGNDNKVFENVLKDYWGWSLSDFQRSIRQELLTDKVLQVLDSGVRKQANAALTALNSGQSFASVAQQYSDDVATKNSGGVMGFLVSKTDPNIPSQTINALYGLKPGQTSGVIDIGYALEIVKNLGYQGDKIQAAHILFTYQDINNYLNNYKAKQKAVVYIKV